MNPKSRLRALQARLSSARAFIEQKKPGLALQEIEAALAIDPDLLAAHLLRDQILRAGDVVGVPARALSVPPATDVGVRTHAATAGPKAAATVSQVATTAVPRPAQAAFPAAAAASLEGIRPLQAVAHRRHVPGALTIASIAAAERESRQAAPIGDIRGVEPPVPDLSVFVAKLEQVLSGGRTRRRVPSVIAAAVWLVTTFWPFSIQETRSLPAHPLVVWASDTAGLVRPAAGKSGGPSGSAAIFSKSAEGEAPGPVETSRAIRLKPDATARTPDATVRTPVATARTPETTARTPDPAGTFPTLPTPSNSTDGGTAAARLPPTVAVTPAEPVVQPAVSPPPLPPSPPALSQPRVVAETTVPAPRALASPSPPNGSASMPLKVDDASLVQQTLQRYRTAYDRLDAHSARAVWPAVNEGALARAFSGLASQTLTFDACDVAVDGEVARATCRGTAKYIQKIGRSEPRVEPRVWTFALRKRASNWEIEDARAGR